MQRMSAMAYDGTPGAPPGKSTGLVNRRCLALRRRRGRPLWLALAIVSLMFNGEATAAPKDGQTFKAWKVRCQKPAGAKQESCHIFQNLVLRKGGRRVLRIVVGYFGKKREPAAVLTLPLGVALVPGVLLQVDDTEPVVFPFRLCHSKGCRARLALDDKLLAAFKAGLRARVTFRDGAQRAIIVPVSLNGFTAGFNALR